MVLLQTPAAASAEFAVRRMVWISFAHVSYSGARGWARPGPDTYGDEMAVIAASSDQFRHLALFYRGGTTTRLHMRLQQS
jgi:hypothetical protein